MFLFIYSFINILENNKSISIPSKTEVLENVQQIIILITQFKLI